MNRMFARGFTIVELLVVLTVLAILAVAALPMAELTVRRSNERELKLALREIRHAIDAYKKAVDDGRVASAANPSGYPPNLETLVAGLPDAKASNQKLYFLRRVPKDPFAEAEESPSSSWGLRSFASPPDNPRPGLDVYDVYSKSNDVGLNGVPYREW
jgi:general secretion pathway protein G